MTDYLVLFALVFGVNLIPVFGPPTWSIVVLYSLNTQLPVAGTVVVAALAAAAGRLVLAHGFRLLGTKVPGRTRRNLAAARALFESRRRAGLIALGLFALSPVPSAQLFEAAGLTGVRLLPFTAAFFAGRLVSYSVYAMSARALRSQTFAAAFLENLQSPAGMAVQLAAVAALVALGQIDWRRVARKRQRRP